MTEPYVIDVDTHITEPPTVWTDRMASKWGDLIPRIENLDGYDVWMINGQPYSKPGNTAMAGFDGVLPDGPKTFDDMPKAAWDAEARLQYMDDNGVYAHVLYPNLGGFGAGSWLQVGDPQFALDAVRAYNDFQSDFSSVAPDRLLPITSLPFWDVEASVEEMLRCAEKNHRGVNFCNQPEKYDQPFLWDEHWYPIWAAAEEAGIPINFHIGGGKMGEQFANGGEMGWRANFSRISSKIFMDNLSCLADLIHGGVCHKYPNLNFVSVESGIGYMPSALETMDWQWRNGGVRDEHPEYDLLPSEYFRRQVYGCFWFENEMLVETLEKYPDNMMFESDFPHPTCQHPGPATPAVGVQAYIETELAGVSPEIREKAVRSTAARLYKVS